MKSVAEICDGLVKILDEQPDGTMSFVRSKLLALGRRCLVELPEARPVMLSDLCEIINGEYQAHGNEAECCHDTWLRLRDFVLESASEKTVDPYGLIKWLHSNKREVTIQNDKPAESKATTQFRGDVKIICPRLLRGPLTLTCRGPVSFAY